MSFPTVHFLRSMDAYTAYDSQGKIKLGTIGFDEYGRRFRYCRAGGSALAPGKLLQDEAPGANFDELAIDGPHAIGDKLITVTNGSAAITANMFAGGFMNVEDDTGEGVAYPIRSHPAAAASASCAITLDVGISVAMAAATTVGLTKAPGAAVIICPATLTGNVVGVPLLSVPAGYYFWAQTGGPCSLLGNGTLVIGQNVMPSASVPGAVDPYTSGGDDVPIVGRVMEVAADTEYSLVHLTLD